MHSGLSYQKNVFLGAKKDVFSKVNYWVSSSDFGSVSVTCPSIERNRIILCINYGEWSGGDPLCVGSLLYCDPLGIRGGVLILFV